MITPQNVIQSIDQKPVPAPTPHAAKTSPAGAPQTVMARMMVTAAPMITARQADIRITGSSISSRTIGMSATSVLPNVEWAGLSDWLNGDPAASEPALVPAWLAAETRNADVPCSIGLAFREAGLYTVLQSSYGDDWSQEIPEFW